MRKCIISICAAICAAVTALADTRTVDDRTWTYSVIGGEATIEGVSPDDGNLSIPAKIGAYPVTGIGDSAFEGRSRLKSVSIPTTVTSIGQYAFADCRALTSIVIPNGVTNVGECAFIRCGGLKSVTVPQCVCDDGLWFAFDADNITKVVIADGVTRISDYAFAGCYDLTLLTIPNTVQFIGESAFEACYALKRVAIPEGVEEIGAAAFMDCFDLETVTLPSSLTSIGECVFAGCISLSGVMLPDNLRSIGASAFEDCYSLSRLTLPNQLEQIGGGAFRSSGLTSAAIPDSVTEIGEGAFAGCTALSRVTITQKILDLGVRNVFDTNLSADIVIADDVGYIPDGAFDGFGKITGVVMSDGVEEIENRAFYDCRSLESLEIPESVHWIGQEAFGNCYGLKEVIGLCGETIGSDSVGNTIGNVFGFEDSSKPRLWETVVVRDGERVVDGFAGMPNLVSVTLPCSVRCIGDRAFYECPKLQRVTIADGEPWVDPYGYDDWMGWIGESAFEGCVSLTRVDIPDNAYEIRERAFYCCGRMAEVVLPDAVEGIGGYAFYGCERLKCINFPEGMKGGDPYGPPDQYYGGVRSIGTGAFGACVNLRDIVLPKVLEYIGEKAFKDCTLLESVTIADGESWDDDKSGSGEIGQYAFENCRNLNHVDIPDRVTRIGNHAFYGCERLTSVTMPECLNEIREYAFQNCYSINEIFLPRSVYEIGYQAFSCLTRVEVDWGDTERIKGLLQTAYVSVSSTTFVERCDDSIVISPDELPEGDVGEPYVARLSVSGGTGPYMWELRNVSADYVEKREDNTFSLNGTAKNWSGSYNCWSYKLPFAFPFYGKTYSQVYVSSSGALTFDNYCYSFYERELQNRVMIAPLWRDWNMENIYVNDSDDSVMIRWCGRNSAANFSATLSKDGTIRLSYGSGNGAGGLIGISAGDGQNYFCRQVVSVMSYDCDIVLSVPSLDLSLSEDGVLSGTPTEAGSYVVTVAVTDAPGSGTLKEYSLVVNGGFAVSFDLGEHGVRTGGGELAQTVKKGGAAIAPEVAANEGWHFIGWDKDFDSVSGDMTVTARYASVPYEDGIYTETVDGIDWTFTVSGGETFVGGGPDSPAILKSTAGVVSIPRTLGGSIVTRIMTSAFEGCVNLTHVDIPEGVEWIDERAFYGCRSLASVTLPEAEVDVYGTILRSGVRSIGSQAFYGCSSLVSINFPEPLWNSAGNCWFEETGLRSIGSQAFENCTGLTAADIPGWVYDIGDRAFANCYALKDVTLPQSVFENASESGNVGLRPIFVLDNSDCPRQWENVTVGYGVRSISGFGNCPNLRTVTLPPTVRYIESCAFQGCAKLECVMISDEVDWEDYEPSGEGYLGSSAFEGCVNLVRVDIPDCVREIYDRAFYGCRSLASVTLPEAEVDVYGTILRSGVRSIGSQAFYGCSSLASINFPGPLWNSADGCWFEETGLRSIGSQAFENCTGLTAVDIPGWVYDIGDRAFANCYALKDVTLPQSVFEDSEGPESGLRSVFDLDNGDRPRQWENVTVGYGVESVNGFGNCPNLRTVTLPPTVRYIGSCAFKNCAKLESVMISDEVDWEHYEPSGEGYLGSSAFEGCVSLVRVDIPDCVREIYDRAFYGCRSLASVTLPEAEVDANGTLLCSGVRSIGSQAFFGCSSLASINFPGPLWNSAEAGWFEETGLWSIGFMAFENCTGLTAVDIPGWVYDIGDRAFANCYALKDVTLPQSVFEDSEGPESGLRSVFDLDNGDRPRQWENVTVGYGVESVNGFGNCPNLRTVTLPPTVRYIGSCAFKNCAKLESVMISDEVDWEHYEPSNEGYVGSSAFEGCVSLVRVDIPDCVREICDRAFYGCRSLASVTLPEAEVDVYGTILRSGVRSIGSQAFYGCSSLASINFPEPLWNSAGNCWFEETGLWMIGFMAFENCTGLTAANIPDCEIGDRAFANCYALKDVTLPQSVFGDSGLRSVFDLDNGDRPRQWENVTVGYGVESVNGFGNCPNLRTVTLPPTVRFIGSCAFKNCAKLESVMISEEIGIGVWFNYSSHHGEGRVESGAFEGCVSLTRVDIPNLVTEIGSRAFYGCAKLTDAELPDSVMSIGSEAFAFCRGLTSVNLPDSVRIEGYDEPFGGVRSIGWGAFDHCTGLTGVDIPDCVEEIGDRAFGNCYGLRDVVLPKRVFDRGLWEVFSNDDGYYQIALGYRCEWENITVGEGVTSIGDRTFGGLEQLKCVTIPGSVTNIGSRAFANCCRLENVLFEGNAPKVVGDSAFSGVGQSCTAWVNIWSSGWGVLIPGKWNGIKILYLRWSPYPAEEPHVQCAENIIATQTENGWLIASGYGSVLTDEDLASVKIMAMLGDGTMVDTTRGYDIVLSADGKSATLKLKPPQFDFLTVEKSAAIKLATANLMVTEARPEKDSDDPIGLLVKVDENDLATKPTVKSGESVGALPVKAVKGLWYQASWGGDLQGLTQGDKVQATSERLYLGVIKQTGASGFYRLSVSEK